jgi:hypothetical protein
MPAFSCQRCQQKVEIEKPASGQVPCPRCGTPMQPAQQEEEKPKGGGESIFQAALDEIVERPGVRIFCSVMSSIVVHVGIFCLVALVTWTASETIAEEQAPPEIHAALVADDSPSDGTGFRFKGKWNKEDREDGPKVFPDKEAIDKPIGPGNEDDSAIPLIPSNSTEKGSGSSAVPGLQGFGAGTTGSNPLGLIGRGGSAGSAGSGRGGGGNGTGFGNGSRPGGGEVFGVGGLPGAKSIVYVVDRSGSMDQVGDFLKNELAKAVNKLNSTQKFNVIWFSDGDPYALSATLVQATEDNKQRLFRHLQDVKFSGSTDPRAAIFKGLELKPELVYILTDGNFEPDFVQAITARNTQKIRINAIGFVFPGGEGHSNLIKLTEQNRGRFKAVDAVKLAGG